MSYQGSACMVAIAKSVREKFLSEVKKSWVTMLQSQNIIQKATVKKIHGVVYHGMKITV